MYVNAAENPQGALLMTNLPKGAGAPLSFGKALDEAIEGVQGAQKTVLSTADMSLDQYKCYISECISRIPMSRTAAQDCIVIKIPDAGFANMQKDPEFENWVLDSIKQTFSWVDPWNALCGGKYEIISFGTKQGQYHAQSWYAGYNGGRGESLFDMNAKEGFWEHRTKLTRKNIERAAKRNIQEQETEMHAIQRQMLEKGGAGIMPVISAADILFGGDLLTKSAEK